MGVRRYCGMPYPNGWAVQFGAACGGSARRAERLKCQSRQGVELTTPITREHALRSALPLDLTARPALYAERCGRHRYFQGDGGNDGDVRLCPVPSCGVAPLGGCEAVPPKRTLGSDTFIATWRFPCNVFLVVRTPTISRRGQWRCRTRSLAGAGTSRERGDLV